MLRDKLHHLSSQLADAKERSKELEDGERGRLSEVLVFLKDVSAEQDGFGKEVYVPTSLWSAYDQI